MEKINENNHLGTENERSAHEWPCALCPLYDDQAGWCKRHLMSVEPDWTCGYYLA